ncbi:hypothetical protein CO683_00750 [Bradyrhizobium ottawaense]|uniref:LuxR C-terminal-related transcriptional regulator n=1 Tax=Bradyrhizobium ottawaense TaxID=931866 RepID=UPI000BEAB3A0|nr:helix-turn-helix transcriptional regulator [Bradyrhizobium ottawaense]PDT71721.1 hypothetical protein CO683_00750 [Bradyrhizobium ottawaense]
MSRNIRRTGIPATIDGEANPEYAPAVVVMLTTRQREVCDLVIQGKTSKEIARQLGISHKTVEDHKTDVYRAMGVNNAVGLIFKVMKENT